LWLDLRSTRQFGKCYSPGLNGESGTIAFCGSRILGSINDEADLGFGGGVKPDNLVGSVLDHATGFNAIANGGEGSSASAVHI
jgi:hypothetical protein